MNTNRSAMNSQLPDRYKQTEIGVIPEDWKCVELDQLNPFITSGSRGWADFYSEYGDPFVRITNMFRDSISLDLQDLRYVNLPVDANEGKRTQLYDSDLLISITADIGIISYVDKRLQKPAYINQHIALVRFNKEKVNSQFISYFLSHESSQKWFRGGTDQGAKAGMSLITVRKIKAAIPPLEEQDAIAHALSDIDALIESLDRLLTKKRQIKQGAMQELLTGKSRIPVFSNKQCYKQTEVGMIPDDWNIQRIGDFCTCFSGGTPSTSNPSYYGGDIAWITSSDLNETRITDVKGRISVEGLTNSAAKLVESQTLLLAMYGATAGVCAITEICGAINQAILAIKPSGVNLEYLFQYLLFRKDFYINTYTQGGQPNFSGEIVKSFLVSFPAFEEEQLEIATILSDMDTEIDSIEAKLTKTRQIKQGMMHELLTGRIRLI
jgi:type I restriction enzyme, S subunit